MSNLRKAAQAVLDRWDGPKWDWLDAGPTADLMKDLRAALATVPSDCPDSHQPAAWMYDFLNTDNREEVIRNWVTQDPSDIDREKGFNVRPLYTAPPECKPLTVAETNALINSVDGLGIGRHVMHKVARAIERDHGIGDNKLIATKSLRWREMRVWSVLSLYI